MALADLLARLEQRTETPDTPCNPGEVSAKPAPILACTLDTPDTPQNSNPVTIPIHYPDRDLAEVACCPDATPADARMGRVVDHLQSDPSLRYAMETDTSDPDAVILTLAIRGKGACELRIPKSRYDAFALLELIEQHTTGFTDRGQTIGLTHGLTAIF